jgi:phosphonate transport system ATP-binding protein
VSERAARGALDLQAVTVRYGAVTALRDVSLRVAPGEAVALVGPSGAGKTTLLSLPGRAGVPTSGSVQVEGVSLADLDSRTLRTLRAGIGFVHQDLRLVPNLRVSQNVLCGRLGRLSLWQSLGIFLKPGTAALVAVHELLERLGIDEQMFQRVDRLSGGQAHRVAIARALFQEPDLLLADEPVASVDPVRGAALLDLLTTVCREEGLTLVVSLHNPDLARRFFPRLVGLRAGRLVFDEPTGHLDDAALAALYELGGDHEL